MWTDETMLSDLEPMKEGSVESEPELILECTVRFSSSATASVSAKPSDPGARFPCIFVMNADGSDQRLLVSSYSMHPLWSPDGEKVAYVVSAYADGLISCDIYMVKADDVAREPTMLTTQPTACVNFSVSTWSPDGNKMAGELDGQIHIVDVSGSGEDKNEPLKITKGPESSNQPDWSPKGTEIAFVRNSEIHKMNTDGSGVTRLTHDPDLDLSPAWSPDGKQMAYVKRYSAGRSAIYIINSDGSNPTLVREFETNSVHLLDWQ
jgi:Tol biopolymer transport system component